MLMLMTAAALAAGQPAATPAPQPMQMPMQMPAGHEKPMNHEQHAAMMEKCCCEHMGDKGHDMNARDAEPHEHGE
jgi:hypothetical protein